MSYEFLIYETIDRVARITLNWPEKINALSIGLQEEIVHAAKTAEADPGIHAVIIRGAGRGFSAGYDITPTQERGEQQATRSIRSDITRMEDMVERWNTLWKLRSWNTLWKLRIPTIAQVHGFCVAGGTDLALHCDMIVVAEDARIDFTPVRAMGAPPTHMWLYSVGPQWAKRLLLTGDLIEGRKAHEIGWAVDVAPAADLDDTALKLATRMSHIGKDLLTANK